MQVVYLAAPYRAKTINGIRDNIRHAEKAATRLWKMGYAVITPHLNSAFMDGLVEARQFLDADIEIMKRCDMVVLTGDWLNSTGVRAELAVADDYSIPVFILDEYDRLIAVSLEQIEGGES